MATKDPKEAAMDVLVFGRKHRLYVGTVRGEALDCEGYPDRGVLLTFERPHCEDYAAYGAVEIAVDIDDVMPLIRLIQHRAESLRRRRRQ